MKNFVALGALALSVMLSTCALAEDEENTQDADQRIGLQVDRICFPSSINGWRALKGQDDAVLLSRSVNHWYYVELAGTCDYHTLNFAQKIAIETIPGGGCLTRGDKIIVEDSGFNRRCTIIRMYEWNDDAPAPDEEQSEAAEADK